MFGFGNFGDSLVQTERSANVALAIADQTELAKIALAQAEAKSLRNAKFLKFGMIGVGALLFLKVMKK